MATTAPLPTDDAVGSLKPLMNHQLCGYVVVNIYMIRLDSCVARLPELLSLSLSFPLFYSHFCHFSRGQLIATL